METVVKALVNGAASAAGSAVMMRLSNSLTPPQSDPTVVEQWQRLNAEVANAEAEAETPQLMIDLRACVRAILNHEASASLTGRRTDTYLGKLRSRIFSLCEDDFGMNMYGIGIVFEHHAHLFVLASFVPISIP